MKGSRKGEDQTFAGSGGPKTLAREIKLNYSIVSDIADGRGTLLYCTVSTTDGLCESKSRRLTSYYVVSVSL